MKSRYLWRSPQSRSAPCLSSGTSTLSANLVHDIAVKCDALQKRYGDVVAVAGLSLHVRRGECFGLLGPNGAGKTTTIEILEGLLAPDGGHVEILGLAWATSERQLRERLGIHL